MLSRTELTHLPTAAMDKGQGREGEVQVLLSDKNRCEANLRCCERIFCGNFYERLVKKSLGRWFEGHMTFMAGMKVTGGLRKSRVDYESHSQHGL
jgi:hypothetical protein